MRPDVQVIIPFRDRGVDPRRGANLDVVLAWWYSHGFAVQVISDGFGLSRDAQFNRHRAYNRAVSGNPKADVFVFAEADMLIHPDQVVAAVSLSLSKPGLVVPFSQYRYLSDAYTATVREAYYDLDDTALAKVWGRTPEDPDSLFNLPAESVMDNRRSIGAVNVVSRKTLLRTGGFTEMTSGNWYDDNITEESFAFLAGPTRWVDGPALHLYHLPGHRGDHLTDEDRQATANNKAVLQRVRRAIRQQNYAAVRAITEARTKA